MNLHFFVRTQQSVHKVGQFTQPNGSTSSAPPDKALGRNCRPAMGSTAAVDSGRRGGLAMSPTAAPQAPAPLVFPSRPRDPQGAMGCLPSPRTACRDHMGGLSLSQGGNVTASEISFYLYPQPAPRRHSCVRELATHNAAHTGRCTRARPGQDPPSAAGSSGWPLDTESHRRGLLLIWACSLGAAL